jgi:hypothetical protein
MGSWSLSSAFAASEQKPWGKTFHEKEWKRADNNVEITQNIKYVNA